MNPVKNLVICVLLAVAAIAALILVACARYEKYHVEDIDQWEDITDDGSDD